jgi:hypothetical protein
MSNKGNITETEHDPHPSNEEHYDRQERPGGAKPPKHEIYPNDAIHDGQQRQNRGSEQPEKSSK